MKETQAAPAGISYKTFGLPFASSERSATEEPDCASANQLFPSAAHLICDKACHLQSRTGSIVTPWSARFRIRISPFPSSGSTDANLEPSGDKSHSASGDRYPAIRATCSPLPFTGSRLKTINWPSLSSDTTQEDDGKEPHAYSYLPIIRVLRAPPCWGVLISRIVVSPALCRSGDAVAVYRSAPWELTIGKK